MTMEPMDKVRAVFRPKRTDNLQNGAETMVGREFTWYAGWRLETGQFVGEWAMIPIAESGKTEAGPWAPLSDLEIVEL